MAVSPIQFQALRNEVDDLNLVVHGDDAKDVPGLRKRMTAVEQLAEQLAEASKLDRERWKWLSKGLLIGLSITSLGSLLAALPQLAALLHGVLP